MESGHPAACELLGLTATGSVDAGRPNPIEALTTTATPARATLLTLAVLLGAAEDATSRQTWRSPTSENRTYFMALRAWGYPLSPVEQLVLADTDVTPTQSDEGVATTDAGDAAGHTADSDKNGEVTSEVTDGGDYGAAEDMVGEDAATD